MVDKQQIVDYLQSGDMTNESAETVADLVERTLKDKNNKIEEFKVDLENLESDIEEWGD